jgi:hemerythrin superfamily protein
MAHTTPHTSRSASSTSSTRKASSAQSATQARKDVLGMLKEDHQKVAQAFKSFQKMQDQKDKDLQACETLVRQTCMELTLHAQLEEETFYPTVRGAISEVDLVDEAEVEHQTLKTLIGQLDGMQPEDDKFAATFCVLGEYVTHHVKEEEGEMFKKLTRAKIDWQHLLDDMQEQREQLIQEIGEDKLMPDGQGRGKATRQ